MCCFVYFHTYGVGIGMPHILLNMSKIEHFVAFTAKQQESCQMINFTQIRRNVRHSITTYHGKTTFGFNLQVLEKDVREFNNLN